MFSVSFAGLLGRILNSSSSVAELTVQWDCPFPPFLPSIRFSLQTSTPGGSIFLMATEKATSLKTYLHEHPPSHGSFFLYQNDKLVFSPLRLKVALKVFCLLWAVL